MALALQLSIHIFIWLSALTSDPKRIIPYVHGSTAPLKINILWLNVQPPPLKIDI